MHLDRAKLDRWLSVTRGDDARVPCALPLESQRNPQASPRGDEGGAAKRRRGRERDRPVSNAPQRDVGDHLLQRRGTEGPHLFFEPSQPYPVNFGERLCLGARGPGKANLDGVRACRDGRDGGVRVDDPHLPTHERDRTERLPVERNYGAARDDAAHAHRNERGRRSVGDEAHDQATGGHFGPCLAVALGVDQRRISCERPRARYSERRSRSEIDERTVVVGSQRAIQSTRSTPRPGRSSLAGGGFPPWRLSTEPEEGVLASTDGEVISRTRVPG